MTLRENDLNLNALNKSNDGFTLIELVVAVAIIGILAAIAIPSYDESMRKSRRADAEGALLALANALERYYTVNNQFCDTGTTGGTSPEAAAANTCGGAANDVGLPPGAIYAPPANTQTFYEIAISDMPDATSYTLTAVPRGAQVNDRCGNLTLTSAGVKGQDAPGTSAECWKN